MTKQVAIHQPNFFPWLGYFDKIGRVDVFIILDDVQYQKTGGTWSNRVKVLINGESNWLTAPVDRSFSGTRAINEMVFSTKENWRVKVLKTLVSTYRRAPCFEQAFALLEPLILNQVENVAEYNTHAIVSLADAIGLPHGVVTRSSNLDIESTATQRLVDLTKSVGGESYLCGGGAVGYQEDEVFTNSGLSLVYQKFVPQPYKQLATSSFIPGLSIIDAAMNLGWRGVGDLIRRSD
jgi:hypothetical protein